MAQLGAGDAAPDFTATTADGGTVSLNDFRGKSEVVLFFYPKDDSPVCTAEACASATATRPSATPAPR